jgi:uncharacterized membrane protein YvbJ
MKYCRHCGAEMVDDAVLCVKCGCPVENITIAGETDAPNMGYAVMSFFLPIVGLILYFMWKDKTPLKAKSCGKGALICVIISFASLIIAICVYVAAIVAIVA